jgi:hypothetical protein
LREQLAAGSADNAKIIAIPWNHKLADAVFAPALLVRCPQLSCVSLASHPNERQTAPSDHRVRRSVAVGQSRPTKDISRIPLTLVSGGPWW